MGEISRRGREWLRALPALTGVTAAMHGCAALMLIAGVLAWEPGKNPRSILGMLAIVATTFFVWTLLRGRRFTALEALAMMATLVTAIGCMTWTTDLTLGAYANGTVLPIVGVYATWFLHPVAGRVVLYLGALGWFAALIHQDESGLAFLGLILVVQTLFATEVLAYIKLRLDRHARIDPLTGTLNRRGVTAVLLHELDRATRRRIPMAVVAVDIDDLREINNSRGHRAGDELLAALTQHWIQGMRRGDDVGRTGGDEFLFVLPMTTKAEAEAYVQRLASTSPGSWSAGVAVAKPGDTMTTLLERADHRMYVAKSLRRTAMLPDVGTHRAYPISAAHDPMDSPTNR